MIWQTAAGNVYVYDGGEAHQEGLPVVCFIHGAAMDHTVWTLFARYWAKSGYNVVSLDLPGHGLSEGKPFDTIEGSAKFLVELLDARLPQGEISWVGHSMGSLIALECARTVKRSAALVMMGTAYPMAVGAPLLDSARANEHMAVDIISLFGHSYGSQLGGNPIAGIHAQSFAERLMEQAGDDVMYLDLNACNEYDAGLEAAGGLSCRTTLILGELDRMTPVRAASGLIDAIPDARVVSLPDCGHMMMTEKPEQTHQALLSAMQVPVGAG